MYSGVRNFGITQKALSLYHSIGKFPVENAAIGDEGRSRRRLGSPYLKLASLLL